MIPAAAFGRLPLEGATPAERQSPIRGVRWARGKVTVVNLVNFGGTFEDRPTTGPVAIVIPTEDGETTRGRSMLPFPLVWSSQKLSAL